MGLVDEYDALDADAVSTRRCAFTDIYEGNHPTVTWDDFVKLMGDPSRKHTVISAVLARHGVTADEHTVGRHRRGGWPGKCKVCARIGQAS